MQFILHAKVENVGEQDILIDEHFLQGRLSKLNGLLVKLDAHID